MDRFKRRIATFRARPLPLARHCIGLLLVAAILLAGLPAVSGYQSEDNSGALDRLNAARAGHGADRLAANEQLDQLAARYLDDLLERRALTPSGYGAVDNRILSEDIAAAIGERGYWYRYVGVVVSYGESADNAIGVAIGTTANGPALFEPAMSDAGMASVVIPDGEPWIAPPPGGVGRDIELEGLTLVVIVTAGAFRAAD